MFVQHKIIAGLFLILSLAFLNAGDHLPDNSHRTVSKVIRDGSHTTLGKRFDPVVKKHPGESGVILLGQGRDAYVARAVLARLAEKSIDVQYYMWHQDTVGRLLIKELLAAADRGVRVRILIDDMYGEDGDKTWSALNAHPNMEVRLYNPFARGRSKNLQFITQLKRVNHRMHSKTYTVDNKASIVGGRNIGNEYFDADTDVAFSDLDALTIGPVVPEVSDQFDEYWSSRHSYPVSTLVAGVEGKEVPANAVGKLRSDLAKFYKEKQTSDYVQAVKNSDFANALRNKSAKFSFSRAKIIHDSAEKMTKSDPNWKEELLMSQLAPYIKQAKKEFILVSPYFVPGKKGADAICRLSEKGVKVKILTNSLASNDVTAVHAGYIRHRKQLLRCGVELYELNEQLKQVEEKRFTWLPGLSKSSLHAKTLTIDKKMMYVGSFNFDQRSLNLNTEIGILFHNPKIAGRASKKFDDNINKVAFKVELVKGTFGQGSLRWIGYNKDGKKAIFNREPYTSSGKRIGVNLMRLLPIDSFL